MTADQCEGVVYMTMLESNDQMPWSFIGLVTILRSNGRRTNKLRIDINQLASQAPDGRDPELV